MPPSTGRLLHDALCLKAAFRLLCQFSTRPDLCGQQTNGVGTGQHVFVTRSDGDELFSSCVFKTVGLSTKRHSSKLANLSFSEKPCLHQLGLVMTDIDCSGFAPLYNLHQGMDSMKNLAMIKKKWMTNMCNIGRRRNTRNVRKEH